MKIIEQIIMWMAIGASLLLYLNNLYKGCQCEKCIKDRNKNGKKI